jgi:hypothetical protein
MVNTAHIRSVPLGVGVARWEFRDTGGSKKQNVGSGLKKLARGLKLTTRRRRKLLGGEVTDFTMGVLHKRWLETGD